MCDDKLNAGEVVATYLSSQSYGRALLGNVQSDDFAKNKQYVLSFTVGFLPMR